MSGEEELMAAMGFASFGRPRLNPKKTKKTHELPQLMPGTELVGKCAQFIGSVETGRHGVVYLLCKRDENITNAEEEDPTPYASLLEELEQEKQKFALLDNSQFLRARTATNVFETLGRHRFLNRSAMKLVALDHIFQWTQYSEDFSFADICGGPGGFSEYLLWRTRDVKDVHGYGITLKGATDNCDWRLSTDFRDLFTVCYGQDGTGNLYSNANIHSFCDVVRGQHPSGVDLVVADGGFLEARSQLNQESIMTRLILAEVLTMFGVLRTGGDFVCKTFELATPAMLELCWILHRCFGRFAVVKPVTSRPASSERYLVARGLRADRPIAGLVKILEDELIQSNNSTNDEFRFLENSKLMREDLAFLHYMKEANETITRSQIQACRRINEYAANRNKRKNREDTVDPKEYYHCWKLAPMPRREASQ